MKQTSIAFVVVSLLVAATSFAAAPARQPPSALVKYLRAAAPRAAIDCGVGRDERTDRTLYQCGAAAVVRGEPFYCVLLPWPGPQSDIEVAAAQQSAISYVFDARVISAVKQQTETTFRMTPVWRIGERPVQPVRLLRGIHPPRFRTTARPAAPLPGTVVLEAAIASDGHVSSIRVLKSLSPALDAAASTLVRQSVQEPARLFGIGVPAIVTIAVDVASGLPSIRPASSGTP